MKFKGMLKTWTFWILFTISFSYSVFTHQRELLVIEEYIGITIGALLNTVTFYAIIWLIWKGFSKINTKKEKS